MPAAIFRSLAVVGCLWVSAAAHASAVANPSRLPITIDCVAVPLNPKDSLQTAVGAFAYAGGLMLRSSQTHRLHGLSDVEVAGEDHLVAVGDMGVLLEARLVLDKARHLVGLAEARLSLLVGENGEPLPGKGEADAEGLALLPNGDRLVSFERHHRIWRYPLGGGPPRAAPAPVGPFPGNGGMEALSPDPEAGADAYRVGAEDSGDTWRCRLSSPECTPDISVPKSDAFGLVALTCLPEHRIAYLLRAFDIFQGSRVSLQIYESNKRIARLDLASPLTVDNYEGLAAVPRSDGSIRFYLLSDDNGNILQRTLLVAFDWRPESQSGP